MPLLPDSPNTFGGIMTTLFNLDQYESPPPRPIDPYWDEMVLDCSGKVEDNGQVTLFYDSSQEPPDPDDFDDHNDFEVAWTDWGKHHPDFKPDMTFPEQTDEEFMDVLEESPVQLPTLPEQLPEQKYSQWTEEYYVTRNGVKRWYFRYCYYDKKIYHIHIPGGSRISELAIERKKWVERAIANFASPIQIQNLIRGGFQN
jgi:hypothetical protein